MLQNIILFYSLAQYIRFTYETLFSFAHLSERNETKTEMVCEYVVGIFYHKGMSEALPDQQLIICKWRRQVFSPRFFPRVIIKYHDELEVSVTHSHGTGLQ